MGGGIPAHPRMQRPRILFLEFFVPALPVLLSVAYMGGVLHASMLTALGSRRFDAANKTPHAIAGRGMLTGHALF